MSELRLLYEEHVRRWQNCKRCPIGSLAYKHAFGAGKLGAPFVFIGEGPGVSEDTLGIPFVGSAGRLLQKALVAAGWGVDDWFLTNLVACRPTDSSGGPNRPPSFTEMANCDARLYELLSIVRPKHLVAVGNVPDSRLLETLGRYSYLKVMFWKIKHPAWLLRKGGENAREWPKYVEDLKLIKRRANENCKKAV